MIPSLSSDLARKINIYKAQGDFKDSIERIILCNELVEYLTKNVITSIDDIPKRFEVITMIDID